MKFIGIRSSLFNAGLILLLAGTGTLFFPYSFYELNGSTLENNPSLLSEIRAHGGFLVGSALLVLIGSFKKDRYQETLFTEPAKDGSQRSQRKIQNNNRRSERTERLRI